MTENNHYYTPEQELAMELKRQEMLKERDNVAFVTAKC